MTEKPMTVAEVANFLRRSIKSVVLARGGFTAAFFLQCLSAIGSY